MDPRHERELRWALRYAAGEMGASSNYGAMATKLELGVSYIGGGLPQTDLSTRAVEAAERERPVRRALEQLPRRMRAVLELGYGDVWTGPRLKAFGRATPVAVLADAAVRAWAGTGATIAPGAGSLPEFLIQLSWRASSDPAAAGVARMVRREAESLLLAAERANEAGL